MVSKLLLGAVFLVGLTLGPLFIPTSPGNAADPTPPFDHSQCQYPDRTTNPPNGCDNSDPCDPANVKGGSGDCTPAPTTKPLIMPEPVSEPVEAQPTVNCNEGK